MQGRNQVGFYELQNSADKRRDDMHAAEREDKPYALGAVGLEIQAPKYNPPSKFRAAAPPSSTGNLIRKK
jgi:hypothetical protein